MLLLLLFLISSTLRSSDAQKPILKNTLCACADFFYEAQSMRNAVKTYDIFFRGFPKSANRFFIIAGWPGGEQNQKTNNFSNSTSPKLSFALCHGILLPPVPEIFWATLMYINMNHDAGSRDWELPSLNPTEDLKYS